MPVDAKEAVRKAEEYYDTSDADRFYANIWGGEDIHIGLYNADGTTDIRSASRKTVERMASLVIGLGPDTRVLDIGAGYGGAARYIAKQYKAPVVCLNISDIQNERNRKLNKEQGLDDLIEVKHGSFEEIPEKDNSFDVVWSQDAILHSGNRRRVLDEVKRVLKPGGQFVFTDPMQADDCPEGVLQPILDRIHLASLGSVKFYDEELRKLGFEKIAVHPLTEQLRNHYSSVRRELQENYDDMIRKSSKEYVDNMIKGLGHWVDGADRGYLAWGIIHYRLKA